MFRFSVGSCCSLGAAMPVLAFLRSTLLCLVVVPVDEGSALAGEEEVFQGARRVVARNGPGRRVLFVVAARAVEAQPFGLLSRVAHVARRSERPVVRGQEQHRRAILE